jgi:hypothetical protein
MEGNPIFMDQHVKIVKNKRHKKTPRGWSGSGNKRLTVWDHNTLYACAEILLLGKNATHKESSQEKSHV